MTWVPDEIKIKKLKKRIKKQQEQIIKLSEKNDNPVSKSIVSFIFGFLSALFLVCMAMGR